MNQKQKEYIERRYREVFKPAYDELMKVYPFTLDDLPGEVWKPIPDYEGYHESNFGRTKRFYKNGNVLILKPYLNRQGYLTVQLCKDGKHKSFRVNRLVATLFIPNPDLKPEVNHLHGRFNNFVDCLEWATGKENMEHAVSTGLKVTAQGCDVYNALFTKEQILYIRGNPDNLTGEQLAEMFHCTPTSISEIQLGKKYANCGGVIRESKNPSSLPEDVKAEIRRLYVKGSREFGSYALGRMFNCCKDTVRKIVNATNQ